MKIPSARSMLFYLLTMPFGVIAFQSSYAEVMTDITATQPTANGSVKFTITDTNGGVAVNVNAAGILATDTPVQKAAKINAAASAAITAAVQPQSDLFSSAVAGATTTITKTGGGGMAVNITADTTGEGANLKIKDSGGNGNNSFWRFVRWLFASNTVVPSGQQYALTTTNSFQAMVTGDGIKTANQLQDELTDQLTTQGVIFTPGVDSISGQQ